MACRINTSRIWTSRLMLEAQSHEVSFFVTWTYAEEPDGRNLRKDQLSASLHRLRAAVARRDRGTVRFYACGEYGDQLGRPHYHGALYGLKRTDIEPDAARPGYSTSPIIASAWKGPHGPGAGVGGNVDVAILTPESAAYITGYVTKKLTTAGDPRLDGRQPEFALMSRRPGIGSTALPVLIEALNTSAGSLFMARHGDVPTAFQTSGRLLPLGPHIRGQLREFFFGDERQPKAAKEKHEHAFNQNVWAHLPPMPVDASQAQRLEAWFEASAEAREAYFASLRQKERKLHKKHSIQQSRKTL